MARRTPWRPIGLYKAAARNQGPLREIVPPRRLLRPEAEYVLDYQPGKR